MCLLNCASVKDYLYNSENWLRSPFHLSNFVRLSSTSKILGFHSNWMENRFRVVLKRCLNVIGRDACATYKVKKADRKAPSRWFTLKYQIMNYAQCGEDANQRIKFGTLVITDISRCLKGHPDKLKYVTVFILTKQHAYTLKELLQFLRDLAHGTQ